MYLLIETRNVGRDRTRLAEAAGAMVLGPASHVNRRRRRAFGEVDRKSAKESKAVAREVRGGFRDSRTVPSRQESISMEGSFTVSSAVSSLQCHLMSLIACHDT